MGRLDRAISHQRYIAKTVQRGQTERAAREPVIAAIRRYEAVRDLPGLSREVTRLELEAHLREANGPVKHGEWIYRWSPAQASVMRMRAARSS